MTVYQVDGYNMTAKQAAAEYAASWPDGVRKIKWIDNGIFMFRDGMAKYTISLHGGLWIIDRTI